MVTAVPGLFMVPVTMVAGYLNIVDNFLPKGLWLLVSLSAILMVLMGMVFIEAFKKWYDMLSAHDPAIGAQAIEPGLARETLPD